MNDFTKDELQMIYSMMLHVRNDYPAIRKDNDACCLKHKLQSMIENYCEHHEHHYYGDIAVAECKQCGMVMLP
jgi:hypothetical protein